MKRGEGGSRKNGLGEMLLSKGSDEGEKRRGVMSSGGGAEWDEDRTVVVMVAAGCG